MSQFVTSLITNVSRLFGVDECVLASNQVGSPKMQHALVSIEDRQTNHFESVLANLALTI